MGKFSGWDTTTISWPCAATTQTPRAALTRLLVSDLPVAAGPPSGMATRRRSAPITPSRSSAGLSPDHSVEGRWGRCAASALWPYGRAQPPVIGRGRGEDRVALLYRAALTSKPPRPVRRTVEGGEYRFKGQWIAAVGVPCSFSAQLDDRTQPRDSTGILSGPTQFIHKKCG
ncbi:hypothetical protein BN873_p10029 [Candidatus Competibacter denitrificans Run_A_D11]|uniref:Uncharacterized protein n=1 Tax=Candidatus Competibacter denitrificans Run_A_D11 TaxID=1400863 RepID=W6MD38_9GAMM|nr:hypothetical protein BN873_p10029 [Candidatus Competibacter denitrificans Run_A_D11]